MAVIYKMLYVAALGFAGHAAVFATVNDLTRCRPKTLTTVAATLAVSFRFLRIWQLSQAADTLLLFARFVLLLDVPLAHTPAADTRIANNAEPYRFGHLVIREQAHFM